MTAVTKGNTAKRPDELQAETHTLQLPVPKEPEIEGITYICPTSDEMGIFTLALADQINNSGNKFDRVVAIAKGGVSWSRYLVDYLGMQGDVLSFVTISGYNATKEKEDRIITGPLPHTVHGEKILLFDEVADGGGTILKAKKHVLNDNGASEVHIATLAYKPRSILKPEYYAFETKAWVAFPHDRREFIEDSAAKWLEINPEIQMGEVSDRLLTIGILPQEVDLFLPNHWTKLQSH